MNLSAVAPSTAVGVIIPAVVTVSVSPSTIAEATAAAGYRCRCSSIYVVRGNIAAGRFRVVVSVIGLGLHTVFLGITQQRIKQDPIHCAHSAGLLLGLAISFPGLGKTLGCSGRLLASGKLFFGGGQQFRHLLH